MTSNTTPSGIVTASAFSGTDNPYKAFDGSSSTRWYANSTAPQNGHSLEYKFSSATIITRISLQSFVVTGSATGIKEFSFYASNDGINYTLLYTGQNSNNTNKQAHLFYNISPFLYYRINVMTSYVSSTYPQTSVGISELEMFQYISGDSDFITGALAGKNVSYVTTNGNDTTGDGTLSKPFATIFKAINSAVDGQGIKIGAGIFNITDGFLYTDYGATSRSALNDLGKNLTIVGENNETVLRYDANNIPTVRDVNVIHFTNGSTLLSNCKIEYTPNRSNNYSNAIFMYSTGSIKNVWFEKKGVSLWSYSYYNNPILMSPVIDNCIFSANNVATSDFNGTPFYKNCIFKTTPSAGTKIFSLTRDVVVADYDTNLTIPADTKNTGDPLILNYSDNTRSNIGVRGGNYQWLIKGIIAFKNLNSLFTIKQPTNLPTTIYIKPSGIMSGRVNISPLFYNYLPTSISIKSISQLYTYFTIPPHNKMESVINIVQPPRTTVNIITSQDAFTRKKIPTLNYGTEQEMLVGGTSDGDEFKSLIQFDLSMIPKNQMLTKASLNLYYDVTNPTGEEIRIKKLVDSWTELGVTWANSPVGTTIENYFNLPSQNGYISIDITNITKQWYKDVNTNCGLILETAQTSTSTRRFYTKERATNKPFLQVEYYDPAIPSFDSSDLFTNLTLRQNVNKDLKTTITIISKYKQEDFPTTIHALNPNMLETFITIRRDSMVTKMNIRRKSEKELNTSITVRQRNMNDLSTSIITSRPFIKTYGVIRRKDVFDLQTNITIRINKSQDIKTKLSISNPTLPTTFSIWSISNLYTTINIKRPEERNIPTKITIRRSGNLDLDTRVNTWKNIDMPINMLVLSGYLATNFTVPHNEKKDLRVRFAISEKFIADMLTRIGVVNLADLETNIEIVEGSSSSGFIIFL